jgi:hypothetical protein
MEVTRELAHKMPSHRLPQGSAPTQVGGTFFQISLRAFSAVTASGSVNDIIKQKQTINVKIVK